MKAEGTARSGNFAGSQARILKGLGKHFVLRESRIVVRICFSMEMVIIPKIFYQFTIVPHPDLALKGITGLQLKYFENDKT